jgi:hypothetical protein
MVDYTTVSPEWKGETVFIIGGGPSFSGQDKELLRGRKVIVINSSCYAIPWADILLFADWRWWHANQKAVAGFAGRVITTCDDVRANNVLHLRRRYPPGLAIDRCEMTVLKTSMTAAINLAVHLGSQRIVTLGLDGGRDETGRTHHHRPHDWGEISGNWKLQAAELATIVQPLRDRGVELINASPGSKIPFWPIASLAEAVALLSEKFSIEDAL